MGPVLNTEAIGYAEAIGHTVTKLSHTMTAPSEIIKYHVDVCTCSESVRPSPSDLVTGVPLTNSVQ